LPASPLPMMIASYFSGTAIRNLLMRNYLSYQFLFLALSSIF